MDKIYLTAEEAAERFSMKTKTMYNWAAKKMVPSHKINGCRRFHIEQLDRFFESKGIKPVKKVA